MLRATSADDLQRHLCRQTPDIVFGMIQKQRSSDAAAGEAGLQAGDLPRQVSAREPAPAYRLGSALAQTPEILNADEHILVLVDEAHRSQAGDLQAALQAGLPNCARIGFTGTPILMGDKKRTHQIFEAPDLIRDKARDMLRHYVTHILPNGFKAQVVAYSRLAVVRYLDAFVLAREELLAEANALDPDLKALDDEALCQRPPRVQAQVQAWRYRDTLHRLDFAPIISGSHNDDPLAFLIVKSMLLTGFDAQIEGVMYLDRPIREAELLQTIARVNRTGHGKKVGIVVDYFGLAHHLKDTLKVYADEDIDGALQSLQDEVPVLRDQHLRVTDLLRRRGIDDLDDHEACVAVLADDRLRAEFTVKLKAFLDTLDVVLPRPEGLPYAADAKRLAFIHARARNRYRDTQVLGKDVGAKVRRLIADIRSGQVAQDALASQVFERLMGLRHRPLPNVDALVDQVMALARANHERLLKA